MVLVARGDLAPCSLSIYGISGAWRLSTMQPIYVYIDTTTKLNNHLRRDEARDLLLDVVVAVREGAPRRNGYYT